MKFELKISGMSCKHCAGHVSNALNELNGASNVSVDLENALAHVELPEALPEAAFKEAIVEAGYQLVSVKEIR